MADVPEGRHAYPPVEFVCTSGAVTSEEVARFFHETYILLSSVFGWAPQKNTMVEWDDLPSRNRALMQAVAASVITKFFPDHLLVQ